MYPNSPHVIGHDEPTMTDLRGVLPGQRPPVDATVLDEPTSEVPIIKPAGPAETEPAVETPETEPTADPLAADTESAEQESEAPEAAPEPAAAEAATDTETETEPEPDTESEPVAEVETETEPVAEVEAEAAPRPAVLPPVLPAFGADTIDTEPAAASEMARMAWSAAPAPPPGLVPAGTGLFEPAAPTADPEPVEAEPVAGLTEVTEPEHGEPEVAQPAWAAPEAELAPVAEAETEPEIAEPSFYEPAVESDAAQLDTQPEPEPALLEPEPEPEPALVEPEPEPEPALVEPEPEPAAVIDPAPAPPPRAPGEVAETPITLWSDADTDRLRTEWRELQAQFIDDPSAAVTGAKALVSGAVRELADTLLAAQHALDPYRNGDRVDTEAMRMAMRSYRDFLKRVLAL